MSEHRASLEKNEVEAEPLHFRRAGGRGEASVNPAARAGESPRPKNKPRGRGSVLPEVGEAHSRGEAGNDRGAKEPQLQGKEQSKEGAGIGENLRPRSKLLELRETLHAKAKENPDYRFYSLYDKLYRSDVLWEAWRRSRANGGVPGPDGESFEQIEERVVSRWLEELTQELREKRYQPGAVLRVWIPKANGKQRPLGIPSIKDRVVQMAAVLILEPIFETDLQPEQHAYREGHSAPQAVQEVHGWLSRGLREAMEHLMGKLKLEVNREKTRVCRVPEESFDFLGYTFTQCYKIDGGKPYIGNKPSGKKIAEVKEKIRQKTERKTLWKTTAEKEEEVNTLLRGWGNYFSLGAASKAYREVDAHARQRMRRWLCQKHKISGRGTKRFPDQYLHEELGLYRLTGSRRNFPWAKA